MKNYHSPLHPGLIYHIYNQVVGKELLFRFDENYRFFLSKYELHLKELCQTYCYNLLPNHFHFVIKINSFNHCIQLFEKVKKRTFDPKLHDLSDFLMERFSNLCNSYTKSYNKVYKRKGALFIDFMKRIEVTNQQDLMTLINFIHFNAKYHRCSKKPLSWNWCSFRDLVTNNNMLINVGEVLNFFGGIDNFKLAHGEMVKPKAEFEFL